MRNIRSHRARIFILTILAAGLVSGQPGTFDFEAVSIKPNISGTASMGGFEMLPSGIYRATNIPLSVLFRFAYDVSDQTMAGAPDWFNRDRFDVAGKAPPGTTYPTLRLLLRSMLASQVKLIVHTEKKPVSAYALLKAKETTNIEPADGAEKLGCVPVGAQGSEAGRHVQCSMTMEELAHALPSLAPKYIDKPVLDQTGLMGRFNFKLDWSAARDIDSAGGLTIFGAVEKLGLKLESRKLPAPVVVIDHVERPTN